MYFYNSLFLNKKIKLIMDNNTKIENNNLNEELNEENKNLNPTLTEMIKELNKYLYHDKITINKEDLYK